MLYVILGLLGLLAFLLIQQWFIKTPASQVRQQLSWIGLWVGGALFVFLLVTGRLAWLWAAGVAALPWVMRAIGTWRIWQQFTSLKRGSNRPHDWRANQSTRQDASDQPMTAVRAAEILGLELPTTKEHVIAAHRALMKQCHPDQGGNDYLAQLLNQARETLLDDLS